MSGGRPLTADRRPPGEASRPAVFLDRDGVLNEEVEYLHRVADFHWVPGAPEAVRRLNEAGRLVLVVTNQAGVARGYYTEADVHALHAHMQAELASVGAHIDAFYHSPYHPDGVVPAFARSHPSRKPGTAMFEQALGEWPVDPARSFMVGDKESDIVPARILGLTTLLVKTGHGRDHAPITTADFVAADLTAAVERILGC